MMLRRVLLCGVILAALGQAVPARAQQCSQCSWWHAFWQSVARDWRRNNCWPDAFVGADRLAVRAPFVLMVKNGWRRQNLIADHHFEEGTAKLNNAGELRVRWIMTGAPPQHRTIYVRRADTPEDTAARVAAVEEYAGKFAEDGQSPTVLETNVSMSGWPAARVDMIDRRSLESAPDPRLPEAGSGGGGESSN
jgi:hypothetical protein